MPPRPPDKIRITSARLCAVEVDGRMRIAPLNFKAIWTERGASLEIDVVMMGPALVTSKAISTPARLDEATSASGLEELLLDTPGLATVALRAVVDGDSKIELSRAYPGSEARKDERLQAVAEIHAQGSDGAAQRVMRELGVSRSTAFRLLREAKEAGLLEPAGKKTTKRKKAAE